MQIEISLAVSHLCKFFSATSSPDLVSKFEQQLTEILKERYEGHWDPDNPIKGNAYRSISYFDRIDPVILQACQQAGCPVEWIQENMPLDFVMWIDPNAVSYRVGDYGTIVTLFGECEEKKKVSAKKSPENYCSPFNSSSEVSDKPCPSFITLPRAKSPIKITAPDPATAVIKKSPPAPVGSPAKQSALAVTSAPVKFISPVSAPVFNTIPSLPTKKAYTSSFNSTSLRAQYYPLIAVDNNISCPSFVTFPRAVPVKITAPSPIY